MPATLDEVRGIIRDSFPGANVEVSLKPDNIITGTIYSEEFKNKDVSARNNLVWERVRNKLGLRGINVGVLFPLAPGERL